MNRIKKGKISLTETEVMYLKNLLSEERFKRFKRLSALQFHSFLRQVNISNRLKVVNEEVSEVMDRMQESFSNTQKAISNLKEEFASISNSISNNNL